jgi:glycosyltransferase involved in cell wall biosynthesis
MTESAHKRRIVISANAAWNILNFRMGLIEALTQSGFEVIAVAPPGPAAERLEALGIAVHPIEMDSKGVSPIRDLALLRAYRRVLGHIRPVLFLGFTAKPNVYGSLAARSLGIAVINNVSGLGTAFIRGGLLGLILSTLYRIAFRGSATIFFQNKDDLGLFVGKGLVAPAQAKLLPGSGIDLDRFRPVAAPIRPDAGITFLLVGRLLWDKGVGEFVAAARRVKAEVPTARFQLLGFLDSENRTAVPREAVAGWVAEGCIEYLGDTDDVRPHIAAADVVVLPSYREGLPRALLEAAAMARPVISTDAPGCRDALEEGETGFLCAPRDAASLAAAMLRMIRLAPEDRATMGRRARARVEREHDQKIVARLYLDAVGEALADGLVARPGQPN